MSDLLFSNFEPVDETKSASKDYDNIKPFFASNYGHSRLFTAIYKGKKVVLKTLKEEFANDAQCREELKKEYEATAQLDNRFIRKALGFENVEGLGDCLVLEYIEGKSLAEHVRVGTLNEKQIKSILIDLCDGLNYMHRHGILHCDLKPENIMVTASDCRAKIIDIGQPEMDYKTDRELLIKENEFIAPELIKNEEGDPRSDVYSVGKIIEFVIERNMLSQYQSVATHCTQFSREQRFDDITEVRSLITKGYSVVKLILILVALAAIALAAYVYVPKIIEKSKAEKAERLAVDFDHEVQRINAETNSLCEKYKMVSIDEPVAVPVSWIADSVRLSQQLAPFLNEEITHEAALMTIESQKQAVLQSRQHDFDALLMTEFRQATDSIASSLKASAVAPSDSLMLDLARQWYQQTH